MAIKAPFQLLMLLGITFLASSVCVSSRQSDRRQSDQDQENPFLFSSNCIQTLFENENGHIRLLQRFDKRSEIFENLQNYRLLEYNSKPHTLFLPQHNDADFILAVLSGRAILTVLNRNDRYSFNLERGDTIKLPAGTIAYLANRDDKEDLRVLDLVIPVNRPGQFQSFLLSGSENQQSFLSAFSKNVLEAAFNSDYKEIERVLIEENEREPQRTRDLRDRRRHQSQESNLIVKVSREQIEELSKNAKSSSKRKASSEYEPFNLGNRDPIYSNKFGNFFESTPEKNPQLKDLAILVNAVEIKEGSILLPHHNSRATLIVTVVEGKGEFELVGHRNDNEQEQEQREERQERSRSSDEQREEDEERSRSSQQVQRYRARLSPGDVFVIPAGHPIAVTASSNLYLVGFGINAENNQRNFLAGEEDNVLSQIDRAVKEVAFPGSAQEVDSLLKNQRQSYFANAQPQQREEESQRKRGPISSIL